jgi:hypothetical protein
MDIGTVRYYESSITRERHKRYMDVEKIGTDWQVVAS